MHTSSITNTKNKLTWKNGLILSKGDPIGTIKLNENYFYEIERMSIHFEVTGKKTTVIKNQFYEVLGNIVSEKMGRKVIITLQDGIEYVMYKPSIWRKKWHLIAYGNTMIDFHYKSKEGEINYMFNNELLILAGLYIIHNN